jgi:hypothetical protein
VCADEQKLHRPLRFLARVGIFQAGTGAAWRLTPLAEFLLNDAHSSVRAGTVIMATLNRYPASFRDASPQDCVKWYPSPPGLARARFPDATGH